MGLAERGPLRDMDNFFSFIQPDNIDRELAVLHPEQVGASLLKNKEHSASGREAISKHESSLPCGWRVRDFDIQFRAAGKVDGTTLGRAHSNF